MSNKRRPPRNSDGSLRRANRPRQLTNRSIIARWVEAETLHLKRLGMSYQTIAEHLMGVARGQRQAVVPVPAEGQFPDEYRISMQAVHLAFKRALVRLPNAEAAELRKLDSERLEEMFLALQAEIRKGDSKAIDAGVRVLAHKARLNGYEAPRSIELGGKEGGAIPIEVARRVLEELDHEKEK
jgi:hypothetical protein